MSDNYYYVGFCSGGLERVGDDVFEHKLIRLAKKCNGEFSGSGFGFGSRDYGFTFKTERSAKRFFAALGRRAHAWRISNRYINYTTKDDIVEL